LDFLLHCVLRSRQREDARKLLKINCEKYPDVLGDHMSWPGKTLCLYVNRRDWEIYWAFSAKITVEIVSRCGMDVSVCVSVCAWVGVRGCVCACVCLPLYYHDYHDHESG
jgi:hypothetical protein